jgi:hypothetical protein
MLDSRTYNTINCVPHTHLYICIYSAKQFRDLLARKHGTDSGLAMIIKQRAKANEIERMDLVGNVKGSDCILGTPTD